MFYFLLFTDENVIQDAAAIRLMDQTRLLLEHIDQSTNISDAFIFTFHSLVTSELQQLP